MIEQIAMSLYQYNVNTMERAEKLSQSTNIYTEHLVDSKHWATEMSYDIAKVYLAQAIERYGVEAAERVRANGP